MPETNSPAQHADAAAEALRALATEALAGLHHPSDAYATLDALSMIAVRLPPAIGPISTYIRRQEEGGHLSSPNLADDLATFRAGLDDAHLAIRNLNVALERALRGLAGIGHDPDAEQP